MKEVKILRGLSGSGKSTIAQELMKAMLAKGKSVVICSADDFFVSPEGNYEFNPKLLGEAHASCRAKFKKSLADGVELIIVDNTNTQKWEFEPYIELALEADYAVNVQVVGNPHNWQDIAGRNTHGVPDKALRRMSERWED